MLLRRKRKDPLLSEVRATRPVYRMCINFDENEERLLREVMDMSGLGLKSTVLEALKVYKQYLEQRGRKMSVVQWAERG